MQKFGEKTIQLEGLECKGLKEGALLPFWNNREEMKLQGREKRNSRQWYGRWESGDGGKGDFVRPYGLQ